MTLLLLLNHTPITPQELGERVTTNAFDFLAKGIGEFKNDPKYSVIHFCTGVELFLKARLMKEHWALIVSNANQADWKEFIEGKCKTVTLDESFTRLAKIANESIPKKQIFLNLADHRNKILHFDHELNRQNSNILRAVAAEQCLAWHLLEKLLTEQWRTYFSHLQKDIRNLDQKMKAHRDYFKHLYEQEYKAEIDKEIAEGSHCEECPSCKNPSAKVTQYLNKPVILRDACKVCGYNSYLYLKLDCTNCQKKVIFQDGNGTCENCEQEYGLEEVKRLLSDDLAKIKTTKPKYASQMEWEFNCSWCDGYHTVIRNDENYICLQCLEHSDNIESCGWCNEGSLNLGDDSGVIGCSQCDGHAGWHSDKDD